jgi:dihydropteroate synthase
MPSSANGIWRLRDRTLELNEPLAAGIVNVTTDSMFSGARSGTAEQAIADGLRLEAEGFGMLDIGAVPARAGEPVHADDEAGRLCPAIEGLAARAAVPISADTFSPDVARRAIAAGAHAINDIGGASDPAMLELVADTGAGLVLTHIEGPPRVDRDPPEYGNVVGHLAEWFEAKLSAAAAAGVAREQVVLDPGLDLDLSVDHGIAILSRLEELTALGRPLYLALSRKDLLGAIAAGSWDRRLGADERLAGTLAATALAVAGGALIFRLHDREALDAMNVAAAISSQ